MRNKWFPSRYHSLQLPPPPLPAPLSSALSLAAGRPGSSSDRKPGRCPRVPRARPDPGTPAAPDPPPGPRPATPRAWHQVNAPGPGPAALPPSRPTSRFRGGNWDSAPTRAGAPAAEPPARARRHRVPSPGPLPAIAVPSPG